MQVKKNKVDKNRDENYFKQSCLLSNGISNVHSESKQVISFLINKKKNATKRKRELK